MIMNISSNVLERLTLKYPEERETLSRLNDLLAEDNPRRPHEYPINRLYETLEPRSVLGLGQILAALVESGVLEKIIRLESPETGISIEQYSSLIEIPDKFYDATSDKEFEVHPEYLQVIYRLAKNKNKGD
jgi:hypothetical protein